MSKRSPPAAPPQGLRLHGTPALAVDGRWQPLERKPAAALAWLALQGPTSRQRLADLLWPASGEDAARNSLRQLLFKLRKAAAAPLVEGTDPLRLADGWPLAAGDGELLAGWTYDDCPELDEWLRQARDQAARTHLAQALQAIDAALAAGELASASSDVAALLAADPACEPAHLRHVQALYLGGHIREALDEAEARAAQLLDRHGVAPSPAFEALRQTLRQAAERAPPPQVPVSVLRPPRLVGRQAELARMAQARAAARVPLVVGEPGLGKSRLLAEHAASVPGGWVVGCRPGDAGVPFGALARWLRSVRGVHPQALDPLPAALVPVLPECAPPATRGPADVAAGAAEVLARAAAAGLSGLAVDDLHFADPASVEALVRLIEAPALEPLRWTLARRPAEGDAALDRLADALLDGGLLEPVPLAPLDEAGVRDLLESLAIPGLSDPALARELWQATGGNPMFALETLKALILHPADRRRGLPRPPNVAALVQRRLRQLSPLALSLARVAALAGPDFDATLAGQVLQLPVLALADAWQELESAQVVREQAFAHDLIHEATLASIPGPVQRHTRRTIAEHLATRDGEPARIAAHWLAADEPARAAPHFAAAARRAEAAARYGEARQLMEQAARCHEQAADPEAAFDTRLALADLLMEAGEFTPATQVLDAFDLRALDPDQQVRLVMQRMHLLSRLADNEGAARLGRDTLADPVLQEDVSPMRMAQLRWTLAMALRTQGDGEAALAELALAEPLLAHAPDPTWRCWFHSQRAIALLLGARVAEAAEPQARSVAAAREVGRHRMLAGCLQNGSTLATGAGQLVEAVGMLDECLSLMADTGGSDVFTQHVRVQRARALVWLGRYQEALGVLEPLSGEAGATLVPYNRARVLGSLAELWTHLGQRRRADEARAGLARVPLDPFERQITALVEEEIAWLDDRPATPALNDAFGPDRSPSVPNLALARVMAWRRQPAACDLAAVSREAEVWRRLGLRGHALAADVIIAAALARRGDAPGTARHADAALAALRRLGPPGIYRP